jgi:hypothetical protein
VKEDIQLNELGLNKLVAAIALIIASFTYEKR